MSPPAARRLLLVSQRPVHYGGGGSVRWQYLTRELPRHGWEVHPVTARANITANEASTDARAAALAAVRARVMNRVGAVLRPAYQCAGLQPEAFPLNAIWSITGRRPIQRAIDQVRPAAVWVTCPPQAALFAAVGALRGDGRLPLVAELRDLWAGSPYFDAGGDLLTRLEGRAFGRADAVVSVTEGCRNRLLALHPEIEGKFELLPNGFDPALLAMRAPRPVAGDRVTLIHVGTLYGDRTIVPLLGALSRPELRERVTLELVGVVDAASAAAIAAIGDDSPRVTIVPAVPWQEAIQRTLAADIAVVINSPGTGGDMALPSKLFEALAVGRPILALTSAGSDTERLLHQLGQSAGCAPPDDEEAIAAAVERLLAAPPPPVDADLLAPWDRSVVARRAADLLNRLAG